MQIETFTKSNLPAVREAIQNALNTVGKAHGMEIKLCNIKFDSHKFSTKVEAKLLTTSGKVKVSDSEHERANAFAGIRGIVFKGRRFLGTKWKFTDGNVYRVIEINTKARKNEINLRRISDGKSFKCSVNTIKFATQIRDGKEVPKAIT